jgi:hypothetical protein
MVLNYDKIVIGSSLEALMFAFNNELPVFFSEAQRPFRFDFLDPSLDLSDLNLVNTERILKTIDSEIKVGLPKEMLWERLMFVLSYFGRAPMANLCKSMRYTGNTLVFSDEYAKIAEIEFNHCYYFGDKNCHKLLSEKPVDTDEYICYDWIAFNRGGKHDVDFIETEDDFVGAIWFYPSDRIDGNSPVKDACVVSRMTKKQLSDFNYSETMARFKMIHEMENRGMKGKFNGYGPNGNPKHYKFRTSHITRGAQKKNGKIKSTQSYIEITNCTEHVLYQSLSSASVAYDRLLRVL